MSTLHRRALLSLTAGAGLLAAGCANTTSTTSTATPPAAPALQGTGDLGVVIERALGALTLVNTSTRQAIGRVEGLGDLSHASVVFSRDGRYAFVF